MGAWYVVFKKIKGRVYAYRQRTYRDHEHVRTISEYIGQAEHLAPLAQKSGLGYSKLTLHDHPLLSVPYLSDRDALREWKNGRLVELTPGDLLPQSEAAILTYMKQGHEEINQAMRGERVMTTELKGHILGIKAALYDPRARLTQNVTLFRAGVMHLHKCKLGERFSQPSITSFTVDCGFANAWHSNVTESKKGFVKCIFELKAQKYDTRYLSLSGMGGGEFEVITTGGEYEVLEVRKQFSRIVVVIRKVGEAI